MFLLLLYKYFSSQSFLFASLTTVLLLQDEKIIQWAQHNMATTQTENIKQQRSAGQKQTFETGTVLKGQHSQQY